MNNGSSDYETVDGWISNALSAEQRHSLPILAEKFLERSNSGNYIEGQTYFNTHTVIACMFGVREIAVSIVANPQSTASQLVEALLVLLAVDTWTGRLYFESTALETALNTKPNDLMEEQRFVCLLGAVINKTVLWRDFRKEVITALEAMLRQANISFKPIVSRIGALKGLNILSLHLGMKSQF
ncbi:MAG TPA: hypothetical protein VGK19_09390 [Capsulimonadaceae bacterium]